MATSIPLPSIHDPRSLAYGFPSLSKGHSHLADPRDASLNTTNGYPSLGQQPLSYLPSMQFLSGPRSSGFFPSNQHSIGHQLDYYHANSHFPPPLALYCYQRPLTGYSHPPHNSYLPENSLAEAHPPVAQPAYRRRTSIACNFCRKRKVKFSFPILSLVYAANLSLDSMQWVPECSW